MISLDATATVLLLATLFHAITLLYVIAKVLRPLLATAINGFINLAHQALGVQGIQTDIVFDRVRGK
jgi:hypothetical protein